ncbi:TPR repeat protein [Labrenzia sp. EL_126]|nr:TPR repeat protein [Labrenzia sp. EL_126]
MLRHCIAIPVAVLLLLTQLSSVLGGTTEVLRPEPVDGNLSRIALVIGNNDYEYVTDLDNPINDATSVGEKLRGLGFTVHLGLDLEIFGLSELIDNFLSRIEDGSEVVVFYAGHGLEVQGSNYLLPVDVPALSVDGERKLRHRAINLTTLLLDLEASGANVSLVILDSCRENPFQANGTRSLGAARGMGDLGTPPDGLFVIYSAGANQLALDNLGPGDANPNGLFTRHFLRLLDEPQLGIRDMMLRLRTVVREEASQVRHKQTPAYYDQLIGEFKLNQRQKPAIAQSQPVVQEDRVSTKTNVADISSPSAIAIRNPEEESCFLEATREFGLETTASTRGYHDFVKLFEQCVGNEDAGLSQAELTEEITMCDHLAASPDDPMRPAGVAGVYFGDIDGPEAAEACSQAVADHPDKARFLFQHARALDYLDRDAEAIDLYASAAAAGSAASMNNLGLMYLNGEGTVKDLGRARELFTQAASLGHSDAMVELGLMHDRGQAEDMTRADEFDWYRKAANLGNRAAINNIGVMYRDGQGVAQDAEEAAKWFTRAANLNFLKAMRNLADLYVSGDGIPPNPAEALKWYRLAADNGSTDAMVDIGILYENGTGVPQDNAQAFIWYEKAANLGNSYGLNNIGILYRDGIGVKEDPEEALSWFLKSAADGNEEGMYNAADLYESGTGTQRDYAKALDWYRKAAEQGNSAAMVNIGLMIYEGKGTDPDPKEEMDWYQKAASLGNRAAMNNIGVMHREGEGVPPDFVKAREWFQKSADEGFPLAMYNLAEYYAGSRYKEQSYEIAAFWMEMSLRSGSERALNELSDNAQAWPSDFRKTFQERLLNAGFYSGAIDGAFGRQTMTAVNRIFDAGG